MRERARKKHTRATAFLHIGARCFHPHPKTRLAMDLFSTRTGALSRCRDGLFSGFTPYPTFCFLGGTPPNGILKAGAHPPALFIDCQWRYKHCSELILSKLSTTNIVFDPFPQSPIIRFIFHLFPARIHRKLPFIFLVVNSSIVFLSSSSPNASRSIPRSLS